MLSYFYSYFCCILYIRIHYLHSTFYIFYLHLNKKQSDNADQHADTCSSKHIFYKMHTAQNTYYTHQKCQNKHNNARCRIAMTVNDAV